jgi:translation initiation factor 3 subunit F
MSAYKATAETTPGHTAVTYATLLTDMENLRSALHHLHSMLDTVLSYVRRVRSGALPMDPAVGRYLMDVVATSVPYFENREQFEKLVQGQVQDVLMVVYLANMTRAQLAIAKRLQLRVDVDGNEAVVPAADEE